MRVATWNINGIRARLDFVLHWLRSRSPDLVALQELKVTDEDLPADAFQAAGYRLVAHTQKAWNGVAVLSRTDIELVRRGLPGEDRQGARLISAKSADLEVINIYCPNGKHVQHGDFIRKLRWLESLLHYIQDRKNPDSPLILCGDFNLCPSGLDSWNEEGLRHRIFHTGEERALFQRLLDWGLIDLFRDRHPEQKSFTWWDYRAGAFHRNEGLRIDFLLGTEPVRERVKDVEIDREYRKKKDGLIASDHAPVIADLD